MQKTVASPSETNQAASTEDLSSTGDDCRLPVTVIILTFNERIHIERCISRIAPHVERVFVVDSFSADDTVEIARRLGAEVVQRRFITQSEQVQWAQDTLPISSEWVLRLDADEYLEPGLIAALRSDLCRLEPEVTGLELKLKVVFKGHFLRWGGYYRTWLTRMWRRGAGRYDARWMDEKISLQHGVSRRLTGGDLVDENLNGITWWTEKHNRYATRQMVDFIDLEYGITEYGRTAASKAANAHNRWKRFLRNTVYRGAPLYLRCVLYFVYRYVVMLGFLDGKHGFIWHSLQGFWFFMLTDVKIEEARAFIAAHGVEAFKAQLSAEHNIRL